MNTSANVVAPTSPSPRLTERRSSTELSRREPDQLPLMAPTTPSRKSTAMANSTKLALASQSKSRRQTGLAASFSEPSQDVTENSLPLLRESTTMAHSTKLARVSTSRATTEESSTRGTAPAVLSRSPQPQKTAKVEGILTSSTSPKRRTHARVTITTDRTPSSTSVGEDKPDCIAKITVAAPGSLVGAKAGVTPQAKMQETPTTPAPVVSPSAARSQMELQMLIRILEKPNLKRTVQELSALLAALSNVSFFKTLDESLRLQCCSVLKHLALEVDTTVFEEGDEGSLFYVILEGSVGVYIADYSASTEAKTQQSQQASLINVADRSSRLNRRNGSTLTTVLPTPRLSRVSASNVDARNAAGNHKSALAPPAAPSQRWKNMVLSGSLTQVSHRRSLSQTATPGCNVTDRTRQEFSTSFGETWTPNVAKTMGLSVSPREELSRELGTDELNEIDDSKLSCISALKAAHRVKRAAGASAVKKMAAVLRRSSARVPPSEMPQKQVSVLSKGAAFGEVALQTNQPRSATIRTKEFTHFVILNRHDYKRMLAEFYSNQQRARVDFLREVSILKKWDQQAVHKLAFLLTIQKFSKRDKVYCTGDIISNMYFVLDGQFAIMMPWNTSDTSTDKRSMRTALSPPKTKEKSIAVTLLTKPQIFGFHGYIRGSTTYTETVECYSVTGSCYSVVSYKLMSRITPKAREQLVRFHQNEEIYHKARNQVIRALDPAKCTTTELYTPQGRVDVIKRAASEVLETVPDANQIKCWNLANPDCIIERTPEEESQMQAERKLKKDRLMEEFRQSNLSFRRLYFTPSKVGMGFKCCARRIPSLRKFAVGSAGNVRKSTPVETEDENSERSDTELIVALSVEPPPRFSPWLPGPPPAQKLDDESSPALVNSDIYVPSSRRRIRQVQMHPTKHVHSPAVLPDPPEVYFSIQAPMTNTDTNPLVTSARSESDAIMHDRLAIERLLRRLSRKHSRVLGTRQIMDRELQ